MRGLKARRFIVKLRALKSTKDKLFNFLGLSNHFCKWEYYSLPCWIAVRIKCDNIRKHLLQDLVTHRHSINCAVGSLTYQPDVLGAICLYFTERPFLEERKSFMCTCLKDISIWGIEIRVVSTFHSISRTGMKPFCFMDNESHAQRMWLVCSWFQGK